MPLEAEPFRHGAVKAWDVQERINTYVVYENSIPILSAAVTEFGVHNTQLMSSKSCLVATLMSFRYVLQRRRASVGEDVGRKPSY